MHVDNGQMIGLPDGFEHRQCFLAVVRQVNLVAGVFQQAADHPLVDRVVFRHQDAQAGVLTRMTGGAASLVPSRSRCRKATGSSGSALRSTTTAPTSVPSDALADSSAASRLVLSTVTVSAPQP